MEFKEYRLSEIMYNFKYGTMPKKDKIKDKIDFDSRTIEEALKEIEENEESPKWLLEALEKGKKFLDKK